RARSAWTLERCQGEDPGHTHTDWYSAAASCVAGDRRAGRDRALHFRRRLAGRVSVFERRVSRDVSRTGTRDREFREEQWWGPTTACSPWRGCAEQEDSAAGSTDAFVLWADAR